MGKYGEQLFVATDAERERLASIERAYDAGTFDTLGKLGIGARWRCLEVGAGAGSVARWLAARVPGGEVTATDLDTRHLAGIEGVRVLRHDVTTDDFPDASFDLIHARMVLSHLPNRTDVLRKLLRWLAPGGVVVVEGFCWYPVNASANDTYRTGMNASDQLSIRLVGTDSMWMHRLPALLGDLGYVDVGLDLHGHVMMRGAPAADMWRRTVAMGRQRAVDAGIATHEDFDAFDALMDDPTFYDHAPLVASTWGRRPA
jgi:SAM-dependent methyltransferase